MASNRVTLEGIVPQPTRVAPSRIEVALPLDRRELLNRIVDAYESPIIRAYSRARFTIININILHILGLCIRDKHRILDVGCGFGLFGCYFASLYPGLSYHGIDIDAERINQARSVAARLGLRNATFQIGDAVDLTLLGTFDAALMIDLMHHLGDAAKRRLIDECVRHLASDGRLIVKDVTTHPPLKLAFTWALDVLMTRGFDMWYWDETTFLATLNGYFAEVDTLPITDWMPYPHIVYLCEQLRDSHRAI